MKRDTHVAAPPPRNFNELRPIGIELGVSCSAAGSSYVSVGDTKVKCCVNAPRPCGKQLLQEVGLLSIDVRFSRGDLRPSCSLDLSSALTDLFERHVILRRYPRQLIEAWLTVEEDVGGLFAACVTGLCLALADCGIQMLDVISTGSAFAFRKPDGGLQLALDLSAEEEAYYERLDPGLTRLHLAYCPNLNAVAYLAQSGDHADAEVLPQLLTMAQAACDVVAVEVNAALKGHIEWVLERRADPLGVGAPCSEVEL